MRFKNKIVIISLCFAAIAALLIPAKTLFAEGGVLAWQLRQPQTVSMAVEAVAVFLLLTACLLLIENKRKRAAAAAVCCAAFCWLHVTFLPMLLSGLYAGFLLLCGRWFRKTFCGMRGGGKRAGAKRQAGGKKRDGGEKRAGIPRSDLPVDYLPADFLLGCSLAISLFCLMSAAGIGSIPMLSGTVLTLGVLFYVSTASAAFKRRGSRSEEERSKEERSLNHAGRPGHSSALRGRAVSSVFWALILTLLLIQVGKMNITLDFDTLWYGVRSEYILDNGNGIYENPGLVGMVYVYSKGLEVLTLPLCDLASHSYLLFFNVWTAAMGLMVCYRIARFFMGRRYALLASVLTASVPAILNMSISAKPDIITWTVQLSMIYYLLCYVEGRETGHLLLAAGAYLLSLTMKPTSLVFSTAVFGMAGIYLLLSRRLSLRAPLCRWLLLLPGLAALIGIWARTMLITGMPVTSVFTSIFAMLGFQIKYPFATGSLPQNWQEESNLHVLLRRLYQMFLAPEGKDMSHVIIAWGTPLIFFLAVCLAAAALIRLGGQSGSQSGGRYKSRKAGRPPARGFAHAVFWPFLAVNLVSLVMLYQVDGNYFILLYTMVILAACSSLAGIRETSVRRVCLALLTPFLAFCVLTAMITNWAWALGFSEIHLFNRGRVNHETRQHEEMIRKGNAQIWEILATDPGNRVIAFGDHPSCLSFPCNVQSYKDITAPWGNVELVNTAEAFEEYMAYAGTEYVYVEAGYIGETSWSWSYGLVKEMIGGGVLTDLLFEDGNVLARVAASPDSAKAGENLRLFNENYRTSERQAAQPVR